MSDRRLAALALEPRGPAAAERLGREVALLAGRLARLLAASSLPREGALLQSQVFLEAMRESLAGAPPSAEGGGSLDGRSSGGHHAIDRLAAGFGLSAFEVDLLLLAGMPEEHEGYGSILRSLHPRGEPRATAGLAAQLLCESQAERLVLRQVLELGAVARSGAISLGGDAPFFERSLLLAEALWPALGGLDVWPAGLRPRSGAVSMSGLQDWLATPEATRAQSALRRDEPRLVLVVAHSEEVAAERAAALAEACGVHAVRLSLPGAGRDEAERLVGLHAVARGIVPILVLVPADGERSAVAPELRTFPGPMMVCARAGSVVVRGARPVVRVDAEGLSPSARRRLWREVLPELASYAPTLAARYSLEPSVAAEVAEDARSLGALQGTPVDLEDVAASVRTRANLALSGGVKVVRPTARWEQLVLPPPQLAQLREARDRLLHQTRVLDEWRFLEKRPGARGVRMLFSGPPGTGKTLSAEVLASDLGVDLLVVDISRVVSKWIGETEKNLAEVFDAAERAQAVLLFDEADALFGRRTEVSDAHDRYANLETAYLLSRLERFEGLAILSTNLRQNIDSAFVRRLEFAVEFDEPSPEERKALWRCHLPDTAPTAPDVDIGQFASLYPIVGGLIRNASVAAGFLAAADGTPISRQHFVRAIRREYEKSGRAFPGLPPGAARA